MLRLRLATVALVLVAIAVAPSHSARAMTPPLNTLNLQLAPAATGTFDNGNAHIGGIAIDNNSGSFLQVSTTGSLVPPYTKGWRESFSTRAASVTVTPVTGPQGQPISSAGSVSTVSLYGSEIGFDNGQAYVQLVQPLLTQSVNVTLPVGALPPGGDNVVVVPAVAGQRISIVGIVVYMFALPAPASADFPSGNWYAAFEVLSYLSATPKAGVWGASLSAGQPSASIAYPTPIVLGVGEQLQVLYNRSSAFANSYALMVVNYYLA